MGSSSGKGVSAKLGCFSRKGLCQPASGLGKRHLFFDGKSEHEQINLLSSSYPSKGTDRLVFIPSRGFCFGFSSWAWRPGHTYMWRTANTKDHYMDRSHIMGGEEERKQWVSEEKPLNTWRITEPVSIRRPTGSQHNIDWEGCEEDTAFDARFSLWFVSNSTIEVNSFPSPKKHPVVLSVLGLQKLLLMRNERRG